MACVITIGVYEFDLPSFLEELEPEYRERYLGEILDRADLDALVAGLPAEGATALLCVEADPEACHRSLIAQRLAARYGIAVAHVRP